MSEGRLTRRIPVRVIAIGLAVVLVVVVVAVSGVFSGSGRARGQIALVPGKPVTTSPSETADAWDALSHGESVTSAAQLLALPQWSIVGAKAAGVSPEQISVSAQAVEGTTLINLKLDAPTAAGAETALAAVIEAVRPTIKQVTGNYDAVVTQPAQGVT